MDQNLENQIILIIEKDVEKFGSCSIRQAANSIFYNNITLSEQKKLAKLMVKKQHLISELKGSEIILKKNLLYNGEMVDSNESYQGLEIIMYAIVGIAAYLVFKVFLPSLSK
jgi:hypothetical protein